MDAILSSLSMRDIGYHFSDKDPQYKDADSMKLLSKVLEMINTGRIEELKAEELYQTTRTANAAERGVSVLEYQYLMNEIHGRH